MDAAPLLARIAEVFEKHGLEAVLIGNAAAAIQGAPITTIDMDFLFRRTPANLKKLPAIAFEGLPAASGRSKSPARFGQPTVATPVSRGGLWLHYCLRNLP